MKSEVVGPDISYDEVQAGKAFGAVEDLGLEIGVVEHQPRLLDKQVDVGIFKFLLAPHPLLLDLLHAIHFLQLLVPVLFDITAVVKVLHRLCQVLQTEVAETSQLVRVVHQCLIGLAMLYSDFAAVNGVLKPILLNEGHSQIICDDGVQRRLSKQTLEILRGLQDEAQLEEEDPMVETAEVVVRLELQTSFKVLQGLREVSLEAQLTTLDEVEVRVLTYSLRRSTDRHDSQTDTQGVEELLQYPNISLIDVPPLRHGGPSPQPVRQDLILIVPLLIHAYIDLSTAPLRSR